VDPPWTNQGNLASESKRDSASIEKKPPETDDNRLPEAQIFGLADSQRSVKKDDFARLTVSSSLGLSLFLMLFG
jgi:hypothetical protein